MASSSTTSPYDPLSREELIARLTELAPPASSSTAAATAAPPPVLKKPKKERKQKASKPFNIHAYSRRKIALRFSYAGWDYNGLAAQSEPTPLPTVEGVLWDALVKGRLVDPDGGFEGCGWSRCGRTDKGVSAAGQVVALYVRSALLPGDVEGIEPARDPKPEPAPKPPPSEDDPSAKPQPPPQPRPTTELRYTQILNSLLPPTIRVSAWSPVAPTFDARFSCTGRHYKYFFSPAPSTLQPALDIARMRDALARLVGEHDFRNFCKIDGSKQIENFRRRIVEAWIDDPAHPGALHTVNLRGSAFLWHQVRCIMAVLFLIGARLEEASIVDALLATTPDKAGALGLGAALDRKPAYEMADDLPLVLFDCYFPPSAVSWRAGPDGPGASEAEEREVERTARTKIASTVQAQLEDFWLRQTLTSHFMHSLLPFEEATQDAPARQTLTPLGAGRTATTGNYIPLLKRKRGELAEEANRKWRETPKGQKLLAKWGNRVPEATEE